jgi:hypothetical protein
VASEELRLGPWSLRTLLRCDDVDAAPPSLRDRGVEGPRVDGGEARLGEELDELLAGEAANTDAIENVDVMWVSSEAVIRFIPVDRIFPPVLAVLEEETGSIRTPMSDRASPRPSSSMKDVS